MLASWEAEAEGARVLGQPALHRETLFLKRNSKKKKPLWWERGREVGVVILRRAMKNKSV